MTYTQLPIDAKDQQTIIDMFDKVLGRPANANEISLLADYSQYQIEKFIRSLPDYNSSIEYQTRQSEIRNLARLFMGHDINVAEIDGWIRVGISDKQIMDFWRTLPEYKALYPGKPDTMDEATYRTIAEKAVTEVPNIRATWEQFNVDAAGNPIKMTDQELQHILYGGAGSAATRLRWAKMQAQSQAAQVPMTRGLNGGMKATVAGPSQPLMEGQVANNPGLLPIEKGAMSAPPLNTPTPFEQLQPAGNKEPSGQFMTPTHFDNWLKSVGMRAKPFDISRAA